MLFLLLNYTALMVYIFMAIHAFWANPRHQLNQLFSVLCLVFAFSTLMEILMKYSLNPTTAVLLNRISQLAWLNYPGLMLLLALSATQNNEVLKHPRLKLFIFTPGIIFSVYEMICIRYTLKLVDLIQGLEYVYIYAFLIISLYLIWMWKKKTPGKGRRGRPKSS